jgi:hypothetical protein
MQLLKAFPTFYETRRVHYRAHNSLTLVPILSQLNPVHTTPSYLSNVHFNIGLPSGFPTSILHKLLFSPFVLHALPILQSVCNRTANHRSLNLQP